MHRADILQISPSMPGSAGGEDPLAANEDAFLAILEEAERFDPDFVTFFELALAHDTNRGDRSRAELAHELPGSFVDRVGERAAALDSYVWVPTYERNGEEVYNSVALVGPDGDFRGSYRKVAPTNGELEGSITPGREFPVWETEFGRVCATICWDVRFDEIALAYRARDVDVMFHPTRGMGIGKLRHWATYHGFHVAYCWTSDRRVFTPHGNEIGRSTNHPTTPSVDLGDDVSARFSPVTINTNMRSYDGGSFDYGDSELNRVQEAYPDELVVHKLADDGIIVLESVDPDVSVREVEAEFDLPTIEGAERRTRELAGETIEGSALLDPDAL